MRTIPTSPEGPFSLDLPSPIESENGGLFISRGLGRHPDRVLSSYEVIYVSRGILRLSEEGRDFSVSPGEYLILVPGVRHWGPEDWPLALEFYWLHFRVRGAAAQPAALQAAQTHRPARLEMPRTGPVEDPERLAELFRWFLDAQEMGDLDQKLANLLCLGILHVLEHRRARPSDDDDRVPLTAREARRILSRSFQDDISTSVIARELDCNPDYLGRIYKKSYGCSIMEDLHALRIKLAKRLLLDENMNVGEVARQCGFADAAYFRRIFKRSAGLAPRDFRTMYSHMHINTN
jgi:AraC-like DNA-binding protein